MLDYLYNAGFTKTFNEFRAEVPELVRSARAMLQIRVVLICCWLKSEFTPDPTSPASGLLVKKWTSIIRMQRKVDRDLGLV
jgi:platelet-activating factor acetylhydrolase IB subunit alpha